MKEDKIALFDFCETLTDFQTADAYVDFVREETQDCRMKKINGWHQLLRKFKLIQIIEKLTRYKLSINKQLKLYQLKGFAYEELDRLARLYYEQRVKPGFIVELNKELKCLQEKGWRIWLVSGGYDLYLKYYVEEFDLDGLISSRIEIKDGICTGRMLGLDCLNKNKVTLLNQVFKNKPSDSIAFSDSRSDLPLLMWANIGVVVSREFHQSWSKTNHFQEIIWIPKK